MADANTAFVVIVGAITSGALFWIGAAFYLTSRRRPTVAPPRAAGPKLSRRRVS